MKPTMLIHLELTTILAPAIFFPLAWLHPHALGSTIFTLTRKRDLP